MRLHVLTFQNYPRPWWPTHQRFPHAPTRVLTDCCCCRMRRSDTVARLVTTYEPPLGLDLGCYQYPAQTWDEKEGPWAKASVPSGAYYEHRIEIECAPGKGCKINPRRKWGKHLREMWRWG